MDQVFKRSHLARVPFISCLMKAGSGFGSLIITKKSKLYLPAAWTTLQGALGVPFHALDESIHKSCVFRSRRTKAFPAEPIGKLYELWVLLKFLMPLTFPINPEPPVTNIVFPAYHFWTGVRDILSCKNKIWEYPLEFRMMFNPPSKKLQSEFLLHGGMAAIFSACNNNLWYSHLLSDRYDTIKFTQKLNYSVKYSHNDNFFSSWKKNLACTLLRFQA